MALLSYSFYIVKPPTNENTLPIPSEIDPRIQMQIMESQLLVKRWNGFPRPLDA